MKVLIDEYGQLNIKAETETEAYALKCWVNKWEDLIEGGLVIEDGENDYRIAPSNNNEPSNDDSFIFIDTDVEREW